MAGRRNRQPQRGAALLIFMILLVTAALTYVVTSLTPETIEIRRMLKTRESLATAREALIWYAETFRDRQNQLEIDAGQPPTHFVYGYLPLPDLGSTANTNPFGCPDYPGGEGCDANLSGSALDKTVIGRFPWALFGTGPLRDGNGECLWYAVSGRHQRIEKATPMNWDTLGQINIVTVDEASPETLRRLLATSHDRPTAIIFSPGPPLPGQSRGGVGSDNVTLCGGNYNPANYLDAGLAAEATAGAYFSGSISTDTGATPLAIETHGKIYQEGTNYKNACANCTLVANDAGMPLPPDQMFDGVRRNAYFRQDINSLLDRMVGCLRDQYYPTPGSSLSANKVSAYPSACYADTVDPQNYFSHYAEMIFVAPGATVMANGQICNGALLFAGQRGRKTPVPSDAGESAVQLRDTADVSTSNVTANKSWPANYLEGTNLKWMSAPGSAFENSDIFLSIPGPGPPPTFSGPEKLERSSSSQSAAQDIVRCIPNTPTYVTTQSAGLAAAGIGQLASYTPATQTLTLGQLPTDGLPFPSSAARFMYGCAWSPETHAMGRGLRSYFKFRINDFGFSTAPAEGFTFTIVDGDNNGTDACGAAAQHLGYSGNNLESPFIVPPKIAIEIDPRTSRNQHPVNLGFYFDETASSTLYNGRNDPSTISTEYRGGHVALVYWGGDTAIDINPDPTTCTSPRIVVDGECSLAPEEDDNVHDEPAYTRPGYPPPPANPAAPSPPLSVPPDAPAGLYKLDPSRSQVPTNQDFHIRLELTRISASYGVTAVRVASTVAIDLANPGVSLAVDGVVLSDNDRVLVKNQTLPLENGVYAYRYSAGAGHYVLERATDASTSLQLTGMVVEVSQGTANARSLWRQATTAPVPDTTALQWHDLRVRVATTQAATNIASPGDRIDNILMRIGDRVLVKDLGLYVWQDAAAPMTAATDAHSGAIVQVQQGSDATGWWRFDGSAWARQSVRVATQVNIPDLNNPGASIDGIALAAGDRVLVKAQTVEAENGIYVWNGAASAMTRAADADTAGELANSLIQVIAGTEIGRAFRQSALTASGTLGTDSLRWTPIEDSPNYTLEAWILPDSITDANRIAAMKNTTRPMIELAPTFTAHLRNNPLIIPYPFRNARIGFTVGQRTSVMDQNFTISNAFTTWID